MLREKLIEQIGACCFRSRLYIELARQWRPCVRACGRAADRHGLCARTFRWLRLQPFELCRNRICTRRMTLCSALRTRPMLKTRTARAPTRKKHIVKIGARMMRRSLHRPARGDFANTLVIAQRCAYAPPYRDPILPSLAGDLEGEAARCWPSSPRQGLEAAA